MLTLLILFLVGFFQDILSALYFRLAIEKKVWQASLVSGVITFFAYTIWLVIAEDLVTGNLHNILALSVGGVAGTATVLKRTKGGSNGQ